MEYYIEEKDGQIKAIQKVASKNKNLGNYFNSDFKFRTHISAKVNIANRNLGLICKTSTFIDNMYTGFDPV